MKGSGRTAATVRISQDLNVFCDWCRFNFFTMEGNSPCEDPLACEHSTEPLAHVENVRRWKAWVVGERAMGFERYDLAA